MISCYKTYNFKSPHTLPETPSRMIKKAYSKSCDLDISLTWGLQSMKLYNYIIGKKHRIPVLIKGNIDTKYLEKLGGYFAIFRPRKYNETRYYTPGSWGTLLYT